MPCAILMPSEGIAVEKPCASRNDQGEICNGYEGRSSTREDALF